MGEISNQQEMHQNNLSQSEECLMRSRTLLEEQRQFNILTQPQSGTAQHRMDQYEPAMEALARESRTLRENLQQQAQQGHVNQKVQAVHEAETARLRGEMNRMGNENFR